MPRYEIVRELAVGGMATVYLATMRGRLVAVKHMHPQLADDPRFTSMFIDEARLTARLHHPNIVSTLDVASVEGRLEIVMEYVAGPSLAKLRSVLDERGEAMPPAIACALVRDALLGLHAAHEATDADGMPLAVVHRDVSPQNLLVGLDGRARVLDFGVAKARRRLEETTGEGFVKGKLSYMPPEQLYGASVDRRADVYAAGIVLWELLCGRQLFGGGPHEIAAKIEMGAIPSPNVSRELDAIVLRALAYHPDDRFATASDMAGALATYVALPTRRQVATWLGRLFAPPRAEWSLEIDFHHVAVGLGAAGLLLAVLAVANATFSFITERGIHEHDAASYSP